MIKNHHLKRQLIASSIISILIMLFGATYLFYSINIFTSRNEEILNNAQEKLHLSTTINTQLKELIQSNIDEAQNPGSHKQIIKSITLELEKELVKLEENENSNAYVNPLKLHIQELIQSSATPIQTNADEKIVYWTSQDQKTLTVINTFIKNIIENRVNQAEENKSSFDLAKTIIMMLIILILLFISFTFYRVIQTLQQLKETTDDLTLINNDFVIAKVKIESSNWILEKSAMISEGISGLDDEREICQVVINMLNVHLQTPAVAIYVRKPESSLFVLRADHGVNKKLAVKEFISGDGFLGKITEDKKIIILENQPHDHLNIQSALVNNSTYAILYCPLVHDNTTLGLIEIAVSDFKEEYRKTLSDYFNRISKTISTRIKFGQSHLLVQDLLDETQRQTEELEAQQEELRITNEELVHKTIY